MTLEGWKPKHILINMDEAWPQGAHTYQLTLVLGKPTEEVALAREHVLALSKWAAGHARNPRHLFFIIQYTQLEARLGRVTLQLCTRWAVIDTRPRTQVVRKKSTGENQQGAEREVARDVTHAAPLLRPLCTHADQHRHTLQHRWASMWLRLCFIWYGCNPACTRP